MRYVACTLLIALLLTGASFAELAELEARAVGEKALGMSLHGADVSSSQVAGDTWYAFEKADGPGRVYRARVNASTGQLVRYSRPFSRPSQATVARVTQEDAEATARAEAERFVGTRADDLRWEVLDSDEFSVVFTGREPTSSDPPRLGLGSSFEVSVSLVDGQVVSYAQSVAMPEAPIAPSVSADEAVVIARAGAGVGDDVELVGEPTLGQHRGEVTWYVRLRVPAADPARTTKDEVWIVDAASGELVRHEEYGTSGVGAAPPQAATTRGRGPDSRDIGSRPDPLAVEGSWGPYLGAVAVYGGASALTVLFVSAVVRLRRHRG